MYLNHVGSSVPEKDFLLVVEVRRLKRAVDQLQTDERLSKMKEVIMI
jgi:hypothetical protein